MHANSVGGTIVMVILKATLPASVMLDLSSVCSILNGIAPKFFVSFDPKIQILVSFTR